MTVALDPGRSVHTVYMNESMSQPLAVAHLGLTLYLENPRHWADGPMAELLRSWHNSLRVRSRDVWFTTSLLDVYKRVERPDDILDAMPIGWVGHLRNQFRFEATDHPTDPVARFVYREAAPRGIRRGGWLQVGWPQWAAPDDVLAFAVEAMNAGPVVAGVGGFFAWFESSERSDAFWCLLRWALRYWGIDLQDPDAMTWRVGAGLPGANWLTIAGTDHPADFGRLPAHLWERDVELISSPNGELLRTGQPMLGDNNHVEPMTLLSEVSTALAPDFTDPPPFVGGFHGTDLHRDWFLRFADPESWAKAPMEAPGLWYPSP